MRRFTLMLVIGVGLLGLPSCSMFSRKSSSDQAEPQPSEAVVAPSQSSSDATAKSDVGVYDSGVSTPSVPTVTRTPLPLSVLDSDESISVEDDEDALPTTPLPGDFRGGLRTPGLPDVLPMTLDGKVNPINL